MPPTREKRVRPLGPCRECHEKHLDYVVRLDLRPKNGELMEVIGKRERVVHVNTVVEVITFTGPAVIGRVVDPLGRVQDRVETRTNRISDALRIVDARKGSEHIALARVSDVDDEVTRRVQLIIAPKLVREDNSLAADEE